MLTLFRTGSLQAQPADDQWSHWHGPANGTAYVKNGPGPNLELAWTLDLMDPNNDLKIDDSLGLRREISTNDTEIRADASAIYLRLLEAQSDRHVWKLDPATGNRIWSLPRSHGEPGGYTAYSFQLVDSPLGFRALHSGGFYENFWTLADVASGKTTNLPELGDSHSAYGRRMLMGRWAWNNRDFNSGTNPSYYFGGKLLWWNGTSYEPTDTPPFALYDSAWDNDRLILFVASGWPLPYDEARFLELDNQGKVRQDVPIKNVILNTSTLFEPQGVARLSVSGDFIYAFEQTTDKEVRLVRRSIRNGFSEAGAVLLNKHTGSGEVLRNQLMETLSMAYAVDGNKLYLHRGDKIIAYSSDLSRVVWQSVVPPLTLKQGNQKNGLSRQTIATDLTWVYLVCDDRLQVRLAETGELAFEHVFVKLPWKRQGVFGVVTPGLVGSLALGAGRVLVGSTEDSSWLWSFRSSTALAPPVIAAPDDIVLFRQDAKPLSLQLKIQTGMGPYTWSIDPSTDARLRGILSVDARGRLSGWTPQAQDVGRSFTIAVSVHGLYGRSAVRTFRVRVDEARVPRTLVDFGASAADDRVGVPGLTTPFLDQYMRNRAVEGPAGVLPPTNAAYTFAGVSGSGRLFREGDEIRLTLFNRGKAPVHMSARVSLKTKGRYDEHDVSFRDMTGDSIDLGAAGVMTLDRAMIPPGRSAVLRHVIRAEESGQYTLVNVAPRPTFNNPRDQRFSADWVNVIIDKIEVVGSAEEGATPSNNPPLAVDDAASVLEDGRVSIPVLANDRDPDGDTLRVGAVSKPQNGEVLAASDGSVTYLPKLNFSGTDTFAYTVVDGHGGEKTPQVTVSVAPVNDAPVARLSVTPNSGTAPIAVTFDARTSSDVEGPIATYSWDFGDGQRASGATARHTYSAGGTYTAKVTVTDAGGRATTQATMITIAAAPPPSLLPNVTINAQDNLAMEGRSNRGTFQIRRAGGSLAAPLEVAYTVSGSAKNELNYARLSGVATIPAGASSVDLALVPINDSAKEGEKSVVLTLKARPEYRVTYPAKAIVRLLDDETPSVLVVATDPVARERGADSGAFTIKRLGPLNTALTVNYTISGTAATGVDYTGPTGQVTLAAGKASITVPVRPILDGSIEPQETVILTIKKSLDYQIAELPSATVSLSE